DGADRRDRRHRPPGAAGCRGGDRLPQRLAHCQKAGAAPPESPPCAKRDAFAFSAGILGLADRPPPRWGRGTSYQLALFFFTFSPACFLTLHPRAVITHAASAGKGRILKLPSDRHLPTRKALI